MPDHSLVYRIRNWDQQFETRGSRKYSRPLARISLPTSLEGLVMRRLLSDPQGAAAYGVWILLLQIAAKTPRRGVLADATGIYTAADLALLTGLPELEVQTALELLCTPRIGLLELVPLEQAWLDNSESAATAAIMSAVTALQHPDSETASVVSSPPVEPAEPDPVTRPTQAPEPPPSVTLPPGSTPRAARRLPDHLSINNFAIPDLAQFQRLAAGSLPAGTAPTERPRQFA